MPQTTLSDRAMGSWLNRRFRDGGAAAAAAVAAPLVSGALLVAQAWLLAHVLHLVIVDHVAPSGLLLFVAATLGLIALRAVIGTGGEIAAIAASASVKLRLRNVLFGRLMDKGPLWTGAQPSGSLSTLMIEEVEGLDGFLVRYLPAMVQASFLPLAFAMLVFPIDWVVGLIFLGTAPFIPVFMMLVGWGAEAASRAQAEALSRLTGRFADRLRGLLTLKLFGRADAETAAIHAASEDLRRRSMKVMRIAFLSSAVLEFFAALGVAGVALYIGLTYLGLVHLRGMPLTLEAGLFCLIMAPEVYQPLRQLAAHYHDRAAAKAAARQIEAKLGELPEPIEPAAAATSVERAREHAPAATVEVHGLVVRTPDGRAVLDGAEVKLPAGMHAAVLGQSGIGKSTLLEALGGLRPYDGSILFDGVEVAAASTTLRPRIALLTQRPHVFAGTIAENIRLARPDACDTAVRLAAERATVTDFADAMPDGLATRIGERGLGLSGGEVQRLALARVYLTDPDLILLDEPTAHLDAATEQRVLDGLLSFAKGRTLLVATHSEAVAARMDKVFRIAGGVLLPAPRPASAAAGRLRGAA